MKAIIAQQGQCFYCGSALANGSPAVESIAGQVVGALCCPELACALMHVFG